jgi:DNA-binding protein HU-beta
MKKSDLIVVVANAAGITKEQAEKAVTATFGAISTSVKGGEKTLIPDFGSFSKTQRKETKAKNMRTGEPIVVPAHGAVRFSPAQKLKDLAK